MDVKSESNAHKTYKVFIWFDAEGMHYFCSCPHHEHRGAFCKHLAVANTERQCRELALA